MVNQSSGLHHQNIRKRIYKKHEKYPHPEKLKRLYDKFIYLIVIIAPITNIPQLLNVWINQDASGVSALSWFSFSGISVAWLVYGILHKDKPILYVNFALMIIQALIAIGAVLY